MSRILSTLSEMDTVGKGVGVNRGVGVRVGVGVGVIVSVGVMVGAGGRGVLVHVAVADGVNVGEGEGVSPIVGVKLGVVDGVAVAVLGLAAGTVGRAVREGDGLGVGLAVGETTETSVGVEVAPHPVTAFVTVTSSSRVISHGIPRLGMVRFRCRFFDLVECGDRVL
jgi:hypothetical protein